MMFCSQGDSLLGLHDGGIHFEGCYTYDHALAAVVVEPLVVDCPATKAPA